MGDILSAYMRCKNTKCIIEGGSKFPIASIVAPCTYASNRFFYSLGQVARKANSLIDNCDKMYNIYY